MFSKNTKTCEYYNCNETISSDHFLCTKHYEDYRSGKIDRCPDCNKFKIKRYERCPICKAKHEESFQQNSKMATAKPKSEYYKRKMEAQEEKDEEAKCFFVYILKLDDGNFYIGQTRELRERISEHKDNKTDSTAKKNPKLQYFEIVQTREIAIEREKELKAIVKANQREIRRMIITFQDYIKTIEI